MLKCRIIFFLWTLNNGRTQVCNCFLTANKTLAFERVNFLGLTPNLREQMNIATLQSLAHSISACAFLCFDWCAEKFDQEERFKIFSVRIFKLRCYIIRAYIAHIGSCVCLVPWIRISFNGIIFDFTRAKISRECIALTELIRNLNRLLYELVECSPICMAVMYYRNRSVEYTNAKWCERSAQVTQSL